jgi:hypothetical protein
LNEIFYFNLLTQRSTNCLVYGAVGDVEWRFGVELQGYRVLGEVKENKKEEIVVSPLCKLQAGISSLMCAVA